MRLRRSSKGYRRGQDKVVAPACTIRRAVQALGRLCPPIVIRCRDISREDRTGIPAMACRMTARSADHYRVLEKVSPSFHTSWGKGVSVSQARASAIMEMVERLCLADLLGAATSELDAAGGARGAHGPPDGEAAADLPLLIDSDPVLKAHLRSAPVRWWRAHSLTREKDVDFPFPLLFQSSNGAASGNSLEEAVLQGLCEVVERHVVTSIFEKQASVPTIDSSTINDPLAIRLLASFESADIGLHLKDFSMGLGIPTVAVLAEDRVGAAGAVPLCAAAGTSVSRDAALIRALLEVAQHRAQLAYLVRTGAEITARNTSCFPELDDLAEASVFTGEARKTSLDALPSFEHADFRAELEFAVAALDRAGFEVMVTDLTPRELAIPVVHVSVPGSRCRAAEGHPYEQLCRYHDRQLGDLETAVALLGHCLHRNPADAKRPDLLRMQASQLERAGLNAAALDCYLRARRHCPKSTFPVLHETILNGIDRMSRRCFVEPARTGPSAPDAHP